MRRTRSGEGVARFSGDSRPGRFLAAGASSGGSTTSFRSGPAGPTRPASPFRSDGGSDRRRRHCLPTLDRGCLARPKLLPGLDGLADESISISLQSAVLGIDDGSNRPAEERARDAAAVLGLTYAESLLSPTALRLGAAARADGTRASSVISLAEIVAGEAAPSSRPETRTEAAAPVESTSFPEAATPPAEPPSTASPSRSSRAASRPGCRSPRSHPRQRRARRRWSSSRLRRSARSSAGRTPSRRAPAPDCR